MTKNRDRLLYSAAVVVPRLPGFLLLPAFAAALTLGEMGQLTTAWIFMDLFSTLAGMGMKQALGRYFPLADSPRQRREILTATLGTAAAGGAFTALAAAGVFAWPDLRARIQFLAEIDARLFLLLMAAALLGNLSSTLIIYLRAEQKAWPFLAGGLVGLVLELGLSGALMAADKITVANLLAVEGAKQAAVLLFIFWMAGGDLLPAFSGETWKRMAGFGAWLVPVGLFEWIAVSTDRFWLGQLASLADAGVYGFFYKFAAPLTILLAGLMMELQSRLYRMRGEEGPAYLRGSLERFLHRAGLQALALSALFPAGFYLATRYLPIFPEAYLPGLKVYPLLTAAVYVFFWGKFYGTALEYRFRTRAILIAQVSGAAAGLVLVPLGIRLCQVSGWNVLSGAAGAALLACLAHTGMKGALAKLGGGARQALKGAGFLAGCLACYLALALPG